MDLQPWGFGHGSSVMDLEKMNTKFKTQKIWIQTQIGRKKKLKTIFQTPTPPKHQTQKSNPYFRPLNTKLKTKYKPQIYTLELKPNHLQPQIRSYQIQMESTSNQTIKPPPLLAATTFFFLVFAWGVDLRGRGREEKRDKQDGIVWVFMKRRGWKTEKENVVLVFKSRLVFLLFLFKIHLDLDSCGFWFLIMFLIFFS